MRPQPTILPSTSIMAASKPSRSAEDTWRTWSAAVLKLTLGLLPRAGAGASSASTSSRFSASWDTDVFVVDDSVILQLIVCCCEWPPTFIWGTMEKRERRKRKVKGFHIIQVDYEIFPLTQSLFVGPRCVVYPLLTFLFLVFLSISPTFWRLNLKSLNLLSENVITVSSMTCNSMKWRVLINVCGFLKLSHADKRMSSLQLLMYVGI